MRHDEITKFKQLLTARRDELLHQGNLGSGMSDAVTEPADSADQARVAQETDLAQRLRQTNSRLLRAIEEALERIRRGTYGICVECEKPISHARLRAVPWARLCLRCKERRT
jgi:DnaK suppressor protein